MVTTETELTSIITSRGKNDGNKMDNCLFEFINLIPSPVVIFSPDTSIIAVNQAMEKHTGFRSRELIKKKSPYPFWPTKYHKSYDRNFKNNLVFFHKTEQIHKRRNGLPCWVECTCKPIFQDGKFIYSVQTITDITLRQITEEKLRRNEERFRLFADHAKDLLYRIVLSPDFEIEFMGQSSISLLGYLPEEFYSDSELIWKVLYPEDKELFINSLKFHTSNNRLTYVRWIKKDGNIIWTE